VLRAIFPGGSITGAPKRRAVEMIAELEPSARGVYCGAIGWFGPGPTADLSIAIRTAVLDPAGISFSVGGGIVADSTCEAEHAETTTKAQAFLRLLAGGASTVGRGPRD
jgi:para-aminobenzoate synthetase component 1